MTESERTKANVQPLPNWSVFEKQRERKTCRGKRCSSTDASDNANNLPVEGSLLQVVNSEDGRKSKKAVQEAAQNILSLKRFKSRLDLIAVKIKGVIGNLDTFDLEEILLAPFRTKGTRQQH